MDHMYNSFKIIKIFLSLSATRLVHILGWVDYPQHFLMFFLIFLQWAFCKYETKLHKLQEISSEWIHSHKPRGLESLGMCKNISFPLGKTTRINHWLCNGGQRRLFRREDLGGSELCVTLAMYTADLGGVIIWLIDCRGCSRPHSECTEIPKDESVLFEAVC